MSGINRILVPADFSSCSKAALAHAVELSERYFGATIDLLHVWEQPLHAGSPPPVLVTSGSHAEQAVRLQQLQEMEALLAEHEAKGVVSFKRLHESGDPVEVILAVARRGKYDLLVMGTHGRTGISRDYLGSIAEKVVRRAPCPVLTIREKPPEQQPGRPASELAAAAPGPDGGHSL